jgi:regulator of cell morphogenesis and NO signaling
MTDNKYLLRSIGEIVKDDFRRAETFREHGIDFCCGGKKTLQQACKEKNIDVITMVNLLGKLESEPGKPGTNFNEWSLDFLCDYIVNTHHRYVLKTLPELVFYTGKISSVHGDHHRELNEVSSLFRKINDELLLHLNKEETVLFPAIKDAVRKKNEVSSALIHSEIERMAVEHEFAGGAMDTINQITGNYLVPEDGCNTYHVTFKLLRDFEDDLHIHVHLENNILYEKALLL